MYSMHLFSENFLKKFIKLRKVSEKGAYYTSVHHIQTS